MFAIIAGGGNVGTFLAQKLNEAGHQALVMERSRAVVENLKGRKLGYTLVWADACEPSDLEDVGAGKADVVAAVTGDDEDNLVIAQLAKYEFRVPKVIGRINNPKNKWLFTRKWGVDIPISAPHLIYQLIEEELSLGDLVVLLKLKNGRFSLSELTVSAGSATAGKSLKELDLPASSLMVAVMRDGEIITPKGETVLQVDDELLFILPSEEEEELQKKING